MPNKKAKSQSILLTVCVLFVLSLVLIGCLGGEETISDPAEENGMDQAVASEGNGDEENGSANSPENDPATITNFSQAPMLDDMDLPAVEERLPDLPKLVNEMPEDQLDFTVGQYGGVLRTVTNEVDWNPDVFVAANEPLINTPGIIGEEFTPNILLDFEVSEDQTEFTFHMREGLKWSDGEPVTTEDVRFAVEDVIFNEEITPTFPIWLRAGSHVDGEPMDFEVIDEYTFKISFDEPYGGWIARLAIQGWRGYTDLLKPAHYLKDYHADYTSIEELKPLIEEEGFEEEEWYNLFTLVDMGNWDLTDPNAIGFPVLYPWMIVDSSDGLATFERNPYYFKIDPEGNQLPYIDKITSRLVQDMEMVGLETISGEVDFSRESTALNRMPLYRENEEEGGYKAVLTESHFTQSDFYLNLTYEDEEWQEVVQDVRFRRALNYALNIDEIIDAVYYGFAEPSTIVDPTYDLDEANRLLDEMGMEIGSDGYRQTPSGEQFSLDFEIGEFAPDYIPLTELIVEYWSDLNLNVSMRTIDRGLWGDRNAANELRATMMWSHTPLWYHDDWGQARWGPLWNRWYTSGGSEGEEPPQDVKDLFTFIDQINTSPPDEAIEIVEKIKDEMNEHVWYFVPVENIQEPLIVNENLGNIPEEGSGAIAIAVNFAAEQLYYKDE